MKPGELQHILQPKMAEIRKYLIRLGASPPDAEDIVQDTVCKAIQYLEVIETKRFSAWMYKAAINRYYDLCRRNKWVPLPIEGVELPDFNIPEDKLLQNEKREEIEAVLAEMMPHHKQLLIMKYELELSYEEIAKLLGIKADHVKSGLYQARKQFQKKYGGEEV